MDTIETRYCGTLELTITYRDETERYDVVITEMHDDARFEQQNGIGLSPYQASHIAVDSPEAFDHIARAALGFASYEDDAIFSYAETNRVIRRERENIMLDLSNLTGDATPVSLAAFIQDNTDPNVAPLDPADVDAMRAMRVGDQVKLVHTGDGSVLVKRVS